MRNTIIWKWIWCLGSELIAPCEKIRLLDINHRALIHFPQYQMPIRPIPLWVVNRFAWLRCVALKFYQHTLDLFRLVISQRTFFEVVLFGLSFFEVQIHNFSTFQNINVSKSFFSSKDELDSIVNNPIDGSRSAEFALEIFELVKSRHLLLYVTIIPIFNLA